MHSPMRSTQPVNYDDLLTKPMPYGSVEEDDDAPISSERNFEPRKESYNNPMKRELWRENLKSKTIAMGTVTHVSKNGDFAFMVAESDHPLYNGLNIFLHMHQVSCNCHHTITGKKNVISEGSRVVVPVMFPNGKGLQAQYIYCERCWQYNIRNASRKEVFVSQLDPLVRADKINFWLMMSSKRHRNREDVLDQSQNPTYCSMLQHKHQKSVSLKRQYMSKTQGIRNEHRSVPSYALSAPLVPEQKTRPAVPSIKSKEDSYTGQTKNPLSSAVLDKLKEKFNRKVS